MKFINKDAEDLYFLILEINQGIMYDYEQKSLHEFRVINEGSLVDLCNSLYGTKPFSNEYYCETFEEGIAHIIYRLNKSHCFLDGNKRTTLLTVLHFIKISDFSNFENDFFTGILTHFLVEMLEEKLSKEDILKWVNKQFKSNML